MVAAGASILLFGDWRLPATGAAAGALALGHIPLFLAIAIAVHRALPGDKARWALPLSLAFAAITELLQPLFGRSGDLRDLAANIAGCGLGYAIASRGSAIAMRVAAGVLATAIAACLAVHPLRSLAAERRAAERYPVLADAESPLERDLWIGSPAVDIALIVDPDSPRPNHVTQVAIAAGAEGWPGATLRVPVRRAGKVTTLAFRARAEAPPLTMGVKLDDDTSLATQCDLEAHWRDFDIPLAGDSAPQRIVFYVEASGEGQAFALDDIRME